MTTHDPLYLIGPDFLMGLPLFPPGDPVDFLIDLPDDLRYAPDHRASIVMPPSPTEWVELAVRSGRALDADELAEAKHLLRLSETDPLTLRGATLARQCQHWCERFLPHGSRIVIAHDGAVLRGEGRSSWQWQDLREAAL